MKVFPPAYYLDEDEYISGKNEKGELEHLTFTTEEDAEEFVDQFSILLDYEESILH